MNPENDHPIVLFDGLCNLCSGSVQFILNHERSHALRFSSLQSEAGITLLNQFKISSKETDSVIFIDGHKVFIKSSAVIAIVAYLKWPWSSVRHTRFIPRAVRDFIYDRVAKNRYPIFGKKVACWIPTPELKGRFL